MVNPKSSFGQDGSGNTRLNSQLSVGIDYITVSVSVMPLESLKTLFRDLALKICPAPVEPVEDFANQPKSRNYKVQYQQYQKYKEKLQKQFTEDTLEHSQKIDTAIVINHNRPFMVSPVTFYPYSFQSTLVAISGGCLIDEPSNLVEKCVIKLSGQFWGQLSLADQLDTLVILSKLPRAKCTRIDAALDDFSKEIIPYDAISKVIKKSQETRQNLFTGFSKASEVINLDNRKVNGEYKTREGTIYLGSRESKNFYRIYWKPDRLRLEREIKRDEADALFQKLVSRCNQKLQVISEYLAQTAIGSIQFLDRIKKDGSIEKNIGRCKAFIWWSKFIEIVGSGIRIKLPAPERSLEKTLKWNTKQVFPSLYAIKQGMGILEFNQYMDTELRGASQKQSKHHEQISDAIRLERLSRQGWQKIA